MEIGRPSTAADTLNKGPRFRSSSCKEPLLFNSSRAAIRLVPNMVPSYPVGTVVDLIFVVSPLSPPHLIHERRNKVFVDGEPLPVDLGLSRWGPSCHFS